MAELWSAESEFLRDLHRAKLEIHHVMCWATIARDILVQDWAQMVHHNTTLSMVSSHNTGFAAQRLRKDQQVVIYPLSKASDPDYLIEQALLIARSLEDGQERYEYHTSKAHPHWVDNFVKSAKDQTIIDQANAMQQPRLTRGQTDTVNTVLKRNRDDHDGDGGGGSGVAGGHGTGHASSSGSTYSGGDAAGGSSSSTSGAMQQGRSNKKARNAADIDPKLHLGFKCIAHCLLSDGFSKYKRISMADNDSDSDSDSPIPTPQVATPLLPHTPPSSSRGLPLSQAMAADTFTGRPRSTSVAWSTASESSTVQSDRSSSSFVTSSGASSPYTTLSESSPKSLRVAPRIEQSTISSKPTITKVGLILTDMVAQSQAGIRVWAGNMYLEGLDVPEDINPLSIIVKLSEWSTNPDVPDGTESKGGSQLRGEAKIYEHIKNVAANWQSTSQSDLDSIVCHYYGLYNDSGSLALVLDNGGDRLPFRKWQDCKDVQLKKDIYEKVVELHTNWGVKHNDVKPRNIVKAEGVIRIIDFHTSEIHVCQGPQLCEELMALRQELEQ
ncbi:hypothetical protein F5880DRAFT_1200622 [Lentinula raphanica]|nr:hypothetical protein F5880DRAFT_1200622 [Lentinula raphanica]